MTLRQTLQRLEKALRRTTKSRRVEGNIKAFSEAHARGMVLDVRTGKETPFDEWMKRKGLTWLNEEGDDPGEPGGE